MKNVARWCLVSVLAIAAIISVISAINESNLKDIVTVYVTVNKIDVENVYIQDTGYNRSILLNEKYETIGMLVYSGILRTYNIQKITHATIAELGISIGTKEYKNIQIRQEVDLDKIAHNRVVYLGQYENELRTSWQPECAVKCLESIITTEQKAIGILDEPLSKIKNRYLGITSNELVDIFRGLKYQSALILKSDIEESLADGDYIIGNFRNGQFSHASMITSQLKVNGKTYYEIMNPMGLRDEEQYCLVEGNLRLNADTRYYRDTSMYSFDLGVAIKNGVKHMKTIALKLMMASVLLAAMIIPAYATETHAQSYEEIVMEELLGALASKEFRSELTTGSTHINVYTGKNREKTGGYDIREYRVATNDGMQLGSIIRISDTTGNIKGMQFNGAGTWTTSRNTDKIDANEAPIISYAIDTVRNANVKKIPIKNDGQYSAGTMQPWCAIACANNLIAYYEQDPTLKPLSLAKVMLPVVFDRQNINDYWHTETSEYQVALSADTDMKYRFYNGINVNQMAHLLRAMGHTTQISYANEKTRISSMNDNIKNNRTGILALKSGTGAGHAIAINGYYIDTLIGSDPAYQNENDRVIMISPVSTTLGSIKLSDVVIYRHDSKPKVYSIESMLTTGKIIPAQTMTIESDHTESDKQCIKDTAEEA